MKLGVLLDSSPFSLHLSPHPHPVLWIGATLFLGLKTYTVGVFQARPAVVHQNSQHSDGRRFQHQSCCGRLFPLWVGLEAAVAVAVAAAPHAVSGAHLEEASQHTSFTCCLLSGIVTFPSWGLKGTFVMRSPTKREECLSSLQGRTKELQCGAVEESILLLLEVLALHTCFAVYTLLGHRIGNCVKLILLCLAVILLVPKSLLLCGLSFE